MHVLRNYLTNLQIASLTLPFSPRSFLFFFYHNNKGFDFNFEFFQPFLKEKKISKKQNRERACKKILFRCEFQFIQICN